MRRPLPALVLLLVSLVAVAQAGTSARRLDVTGTYASNWDEVKLVQDGDRVTGTYVCCGGGTIEGRIIEGRVLRYRWSEPRGAGHGEGVWTIEKNGRLVGTWGHGQSTDDGGPWTLVPQAQAARIAQ